MELQSIKQQNINKSQNIITQAITEGAKDSAPRSLAIAEKSISELDAFITANRHNEIEIKAHSNKVLSNANHLLKITRYSKTARTNSSEDTALIIESEQEKVVDKNQQLYQNNKLLINSQNNNTLQNKKNKILTESNEQLSEDKIFNQKFDTARNSFNPEEAEVYKDGNTLIIRLKGLGFSASKSELSSSNIILIDKVKKVIADFGSNEIIVQGHTDSTGGKKINQEVSTNRANTVKQYLLTNSIGNAPQIEAIGLDYQKPIATNKTFEGRAKNRRVDILILAKNEPNSNPN